MKEPRKNKPYASSKKDCQSCAKAIYLGDGDYSCDACGELVIVIEDWMPSEGYKTLCKKWVEQGLSF